MLIILPLTLLITFSLMKALGQTLNIMTLGALAIALGLVIDDGIVVVENIFHELEQGRSRRAAIARGHAGDYAGDGRLVADDDGGVPAADVSGRRHRPVFRPARPRHGRDPAGLAGSGPAVDASLADYFCRKASANDDEDREAEPDVRCARSAFSRACLTMW